MVPGIKAGEGGISEKNGPLDDLISVPASEPISGPLQTQALFIGCQIGVKGELTPSHGEQPAGSKGNAAKGRGPGDCDFVEEKGGVKKII